MDSIPYVQSMVKPMHFQPSIYKYTCVYKQSQVRQGPTAPNNSATTWYMSAYFF